ncbi:DUF4269 domain-containing protein [Ancylobacter defluvii]|uniref:Phage capsid protein n=1 Tax=Ancylobacter defluvii TaxID=1282440 RepID=A0A9W6JVH2_9HYPH|nr:DUF4269 domain-containing protein [Ancylobacter defluvii]MBS7590455.1 DUF4269 domain-containing protein [Ancylobacter defluvii]GLK83376.1 hypothetical protein GCM10017653_14450 [Ancylobacter defluvii]
MSTPPPGLDLGGSDIDIVCRAPDPDAVARLMWDHFGDRQQFLLWRWRAGDRPVVACFTAAGWPFEVFAAPRPVAEQAGWQHFRVEQRLLARGGEELRRAVMARRRAGMKTEPAFAAALGLAGDPYAALLELGGCDAALDRALAAAGFSGAGQLPDGLGTCRITNG